MESSRLRALFQKEPRSASVTAYLDLSATCTLGRVAPAECKCYFELDFRKMTVPEVERQFGNFVSASGATHVPREPKISSFLAANKVMARAGSAQL
jgi:CRP-like cAMP-binding protein